MASNLQWRRFCRGAAAAPAGGGPSAAGYRVTASPWRGVRPLAHFQNRAHLFHVEMAFAGRPLLHRLLPCRCWGQRGLVNGGGGGGWQRRLLLGRRRGGHCRWKNAPEPGDWVGRAAGAGEGQAAEAGHHAAATAHHRRWADCGQYTSMHTVICTPCMHGRRRHLHHQGSAWRQGALRAPTGVDRR